MSKISFCKQTPSSSQSFREDPLGDWETRCWQLHDTKLVEVSACWQALWNHRAMFSPMPLVLSRCDLASIASLDQYSSAVVECHRLWSVPNHQLIGLQALAVIWLRWSYILRRPWLAELRESSCWRVERVYGSFCWMHARFHLLQAELWDSM